MGKPLEFVSLFVRRDSVRPNPAGDHAVFALCSVTKRKFVKKHEFATVYFSFLRGPKSSDTAVVSHRDFKAEKLTECLHLITGAMSSRATPSRQTMSVEQRPLGWWNYVFSGVAPAGAAVFTNPLDVARVRMQLNGEGSAKAKMSIVE